MAPRRSETILSGIALGALALVYLIHFAVVCTLAVDFPQLDEWTFLIEPERLESPSWRWLLRPHNEHLIVPTKVLASLSYHLNGWDLVSLQAAGFLLFGLLVLTILRLARRLDPEIPWWLVAAVAVFLLSTLNHQNHLWAIQSVLSFALLGFFLAAAALFSESQHSLTLVFGSACVWLACYSAAGGLIASLPLLTCFLIFKGLRARAAPSRPARRAEVVQGLAVAAMVTPGILLWFYLNRLQRPTQPEYTWPWTAEFWRYFVNEAALVFGYDERPPLVWGALCLLLILAPLVACLLGARHDPSASRWALLAVTAGLLTILLVLAFGRASTRDMLSPRIASRYFIFAGCLLPFVLVAWRAFTRSLPRYLRWGVVAVLWLLCARGYSDDWTIEPYQRTAGALHELEAGVRDYYHGDAEQAPRILGPRGLENELDVARDLGVSFARRLAAGSSVRYPPRNDSPIGYVRALRADGTLEGWALDPDTPELALRVSLFLRRPDGRLRALATARADAPRPDVNTATGLPGDHGFRLTIPPGLRSRDRGMFRVYADDSSLGGGRTWLPSGGILGEPKTAGRLIGFVDAVSEDAEVISGWALEPGRPSRPVRVALLEPEGTRGGMRLVGRAKTGEPRADVESAFGFPGNPGFRLPIPDELRDGRRHPLFVQAADEVRERRMMLNRQALELTLACRCADTDP